MLSIKYIRIRKNRPLEARLASIWCAACNELNIPCVLIYVNEEDAYISANLNHLEHTPDLTLQADIVHEKLVSIQHEFTGSDKGYWSHNHGYHTFDGIPKAKAQEAAGTIFQVIKTNCLTENQTATL